MASVLAERDPEIARAIEQEVERQRRNVVLIASENYASRAVLEAQGSALTNKYAEGYPGRRYYGGCEFVDIAEQLAIDRAGELFGAEHANVQPHAGASANMEAYAALLEVGDTVMGLRLDQGGHLTHGSPVNFSSKLYNFVAYGLDAETEQLDYDVIATMAREHKPKVILAGYTAYPRAIDFERFAARFERLAETDEERRLGREVARLYGEFKALGDEIVALAGRQRGALETFRRNSLEIHEIIDEKLQKAIDITTPDGVRKWQAAAAQQSARRSA